MRRNQDLVGETEQQTAVGERPRPPAALPPARSREEEASLIAERLAVLVASRKFSDPVAPSRPPAPPRAAAPPPAAPLPAAPPAAAPPVPAPPSTVVSSPASPNAPAAPSTEKPKGRRKRGGRRAARQTAGAGENVEAPRHTGRLLGNLLLTRGFIVESELQYALSLQAQSGHPIGQILIELGLITEDDLVELLAEQRRMQVIDPARIVCDPELLARLRKADAHRLGALPFRVADGRIHVVIADPSNGNAIAELMNLLDGQLRLFLATRGAIDAAIDRVYD